LARLGYYITGIDISSEMLGELKSTIQRNKIRNLHCVNADVTKIPYGDGAFDISVATHLFYFIREWKQACEEISRVTRGPIVLLHTGMGKEYAELNDSYKKFCTTHGVNFPFLGVSSTSEVVEYLASRNHRVASEKRWTWRKKVNMTEALFYIEQRSYSFTLWADDEVHNKAVRFLKNTYTGTKAFEDRISVIVLEKART
jgi:ubiquinone/menaquinone biosynthesis C-methylase UbiE